MNDALLLKGTFEQRKANSRPGSANIPKNTSVGIDQIEKLKQDLFKVIDFWTYQKLKIKPLVSVCYETVIAKSNRIKGLFHGSIIENNRSIVGAKYKDYKHIITHCVDLSILKQSYDDLHKVLCFLNSNFKNLITHQNVADINRNKYKSSLAKFALSKSKLVNIIVDAYYVEEIKVETEVNEISEGSLITIYNTGTSTKDIMQQLEIDYIDRRTIDETTILLNPDQFRLLKLKAPYLIAMAVTDMRDIALDNSTLDKTSSLSIPKPQNEPIVGVIDTMFDENAYFSEWVEFKNMLSSDIPLSLEDKFHGTQVTSIIVDGPTLNENLDDGCGRFRVRHFGVATDKRFSSFTVLKSIEEIIISNRDIKVWNLSLGSILEVNDNFISPEAAILDRIQYENDVLFVIAGTNKPINSNVKKIGAPADSINSIVVNSVMFDNKPASYSRRGIVLSFFNKPDVSYYGGDGNQSITTHNGVSIIHSKGTSFAAPWITRKAAYLIEVIGLSRELAKASIIDSTTKWENQSEPSDLVGFGVVPIRIEDIIKCRDDEIKFLLSASSEKFNTYNYNIPIPTDNNKQSFIAKATLCYFPCCNRNQGVDYTNTELDLHFGRLIKQQDRVVIQTINDNKQCIDDEYYLQEEGARKIFRKWDNVKHIRENFLTEKGRIRKPKKQCGDGSWGISIKTKERLSNNDGQNLKFGVVVTLKELNGKNKIDEFIQKCQYKGWLVNRIDIKNRVQIFNKVKEDIEFN